MRLFRRKAPPQGFTGDWKHRIGDLFECGVDYSGRTVLDAGCNMGIIAYEISKRGPKLIHGVDRGKRYVDIARDIFLGVAIESRFDRVDLARASALTKILLPRYDVVVFLSVYQHLIRRGVRKPAEEALRALLRRCATDFVLRLPLEFLAEAEAIVVAEGFERTFTGEQMPMPTSAPGRAHRTSRIYAYRRK